MRPGHELACCLLLSALAACGGDASRPDASSAGQGGDASTPAAGSTNVTGSTGVAGSTGSGGSTLGAACLTAADCDADQFCDAGGYGCDDAELWGATCTLRPTECSEREAGPVCGCDGAVHDSVCAANAAGVDVAMYGPGSCASVPGMFRCGSKYCDSGGDYCEEYLEIGFVCAPLPASCAGDAQPTCDACFGGDLPGGCRQCYDSGPITLMCTNL